MVGPHLGGEGMIFAVAQWDGRAALAMGREAEANGIAFDFDPEVTARIACSPAHKHHRVVFVKGGAPLQSVGVELFKHLRQATFAHDAPRILFFGGAARLICFLAQDIFRAYVVLARNDSSSNALFARILPLIQRRLINRDNDGRCPL